MAWTRSRSLAADLVRPDGDDTNAARRRPAHTATPFSSVYNLGNRMVEPNRFNQGQFYMPIA